MTLSYCRVSEFGSSDIRGARSLPSSSMEVLLLLLVPSVPPTLQDMTC